MLSKQQKKHQALLNTLLENVTTVQVKFQDGQTNGQAHYTYKVPTAWGVKADDELVVESPRSGMAVVKVVNVDKVPQLDADADFTYKWAVQKVDRSGYDAQLKREALFLEQLAEVERLSVRAETLAKVSTALQDKPDAAAAFQKAVFALNGVDDAAQAPKAAMAS